MSLPLSPIVLPDQSDAVVFAPDRDHADGCVIEHKRAPLRERYLPDNVSRLAMTN
ncbi:MAG: hypothetical protein LBQ81_05890 [Zoogloeaceae bacterium]|nr:hypothetical protein [Zoogloeaceae bacterium]